MVQRNAAGSLRVSLNYLSPREWGDKGGESEYEDSAGGFASLNPPYPLLPATRCNISFGGLAIALSVGRVLRVVLPSPTLSHQGGGNRSVPPKRRRRCSAAGGLGVSPQPTLSTSIGGLRGLKDAASFLLRSDQVHWLLHLRGGLQGLA